MQSRFFCATAVAATLWAAGATQAQTPPADGAWRGTLGAGATVSSGNTRSSSVSANGEALRLTAEDRLRFYATGLYGKSGDATTANLWRAGGKYDRDLNRSLYAFGGLDFEHDTIANLKLRSGISGGLGLHVIRNEQTTFNVFGGLAYTKDSFDKPVFISGRNRESYSRPELMLGEESTHKLSSTVSVRQSLLVYPNLDDRGAYRSVFDSGLAVALSGKMNLNVGLQHRYNSDPGVGIKKSDVLFITGVSVKFD